MKLSITIVTLNRAQKLRSAILSCLSSNLPKMTEFMILDNGSIDSTQEIVEKCLNESGYIYNYIKNYENIGAGAGRNFCFEHSSGELIYGMDDDAEIDFKNYPNFFIDAINIFDQNTQIATLATQIYDNAWSDYRQKIKGKKISEDLYKCKMFSGGSHFIRKSSFEKPPYFSNKYGYEELPPSLISYDKGFINAFAPSLIAIHNPDFNKWNYEDKSNINLLINECAVPYSIKKMMYPDLFIPLVWLAFTFRKFKHLKYNKENFNNVKNVIEYTMRNYTINQKIKIVTVCKLFIDYGFEIF